MFIHLINNLFNFFLSAIGAGGNYTLVANLSVTFSEAQAYCRINFIDLPSIRNLSENEAVRVAGAGNAIFIGLYRIRMWSDNSDSSFRNWRSGQPDYNFDERQCTAVSFSDSGQWTDEECTQTYPFFCYTGKHPPSVVHFYHSFSTHKLPHRIH